MHIELLRSPFFSLNPPRGSSNRRFQSYDSRPRGVLLAEALSPKIVPININRLVSGNITHAIYRHQLLAGSDTTEGPFYAQQCAHFLCYATYCQLLSYNTCIDTHRYLIAVGRTERADRIQSVRRRAVLRLRFDRQYRVIAGRIAVRVHVHLKAAREIQYA